MSGFGRLIGVGVASNFRRATHIKKSLGILGQLYGHMQISRLYRSPDVSKKGAFYWNLAVRFESPSSLREIRSNLKSIEICCGRLKRAKELGRVSVDLDLLLEEDLDSSCVRWVADISDSGLVAALPLLDVLSSQDSHALGLKRGDYFKTYSYEEYCVMNIKWDSIL